jgi:hypothetical protein
MNPNEDLNKFSWFIETASRQDAQVGNEFLFGFHGAHFVLARSLFRRRFSSSSSVDADWPTSLGHARHVSRVFAMCGVANGLRCASLAASQRRRSAP